MEEKRKIKFDVKEFFNYPYYILTATVTKISICSVRNNYKRDNTNNKQTIMLNLKNDNLPEKNERVKQH